VTLRSDQVCAANAVDDPASRARIDVLYRLTSGYAQP
jgi:hypothetical protein